MPKGLPKHRSNTNDEQMGGKHGSMVQTTVDDRDNGSGKRHSKRLGTGRSYANYEEQSLQEVVVGLYLGSSLCGYGYCTNIDDMNPEIILNEPWRNEDGAAFNTSPIAILYTEDNPYIIKPFKYGYEALTYQIEDPKKYFLCETYRTAYEKLTVDEGHAVERKLRQPDVTKFLEHVLQGLKEKVEAELMLNKLWTPHNGPEIKWILAYPCMIHSTGLTVDSFGEIAKKVIKSSNVTLQSEEKVAALWCVEMPLFDLKGASDPRMPLNTLCAVIDLQSEYVSVIRKETEGDYVKVHATIHIQCNLDTLFMKLLCQQFEPEKVINFKRCQPKAWAQMLRHFKIKIHCFNGNDRAVIDVPFEYVFERLVVGQSQSNKIEYDNEYISCKNDLLLINAEYLEKIFDQFAEKVLTELGTIVQHKPIKYLFLIGWASVLDTPINKLSRPTKRGFPIVEKVKIPQDSNACALKGAVLCGKYI